jgi:DNA-binding NtrC family response regulator
MPSVLIAEDQEGLRKVVREYLLRESFEVEDVGSADEALALLANRHFDLLVTDVRMPGTGGDRAGLELLKRVKATDPDTIVILMTAYKDVDVAVEAMKVGAFDFMTKGEDFSAPALVARIKKAIEGAQMLKDNRILRTNLSLHYDPSRIIWRSPKMAEVMELVKKVAATNSTVLIEGDSGTGKELVAHAIHAQSERATRPLVKVHCGMLSEGILESELFGHEKGSFTGAHARKQGRFELADGGSIFLDEIADTPPLVQMKLLRVLQEREFERVGGTVAVRVDVRVIAATKFSLKELAKTPKFREDLYFRLNVVNIRIPNLRERKEDVPVLAQYFVERYRADARRDVRGVSPAALDLLQQYPWPGNVRELENHIQRALVLSDGDWIEPRDLPADVRLGDEALSLSGAELAKNREDQERAAIVEALTLERGNRSRAAARLNLNRTTLLYKMKKYGLIG